MCHNIIAIERDVEVRLKSQQAGLDSRESLRKIETLSPKRAERSKRDDSMWVIAEYVVLGWVQISFLMCDIQQYEQRAE